MLNPPDSGTEHCHSCVGVCMCVYVCPYISIEFVCNGPFATMMSFTCGWSKCMLIRVFNTLHRAKALQKKHFYTPKRAAVYKSTLAIHCYSNII